MPGVPARPPETTPGGQRDQKCSAAGVPEYREATRLGVYKLVGMGWRKELAPGDNPCPPGASCPGPMPPYLLSLLCFSQVEWSPASLICPSPGSSTRRCAYSHSPPCPQKKGELNILQLHQSKDKKPRLGSFMKCVQFCFQFLKK